MTDNAYYFQLALGIMVLGGLLGVIALIWFRDVWQGERHDGE